MRRMANSVKDEVVDVLCTKIGIKRSSCYTGSGKDLLTVLPTGFGKSSILQALVPEVKEIMTGKPSSVVVVCPLQRAVHDQME